MDDIADLVEFNERVTEGGKTLEPANKVRPRATASYDEAVSADEDGNSKGPTMNAQMWAVYGERNFSACEKAVPTLPPGQYTIEVSDSLGIYFRRTDINLDELIHLPDSVSEQVINEIESFWSKEEHFRKFGFLWKRGVLMWGPPGSGKTSTLQIISERIIAQGGMSVYVDRPSLAAKGLKMMRQVEKHRPIVVMLEDIDAIIDNYGEADLLALMDGELQIDNVVFVATTNYPERLDKRFINRPSRFDIVKKIGMPGEEARAIYLKTKNTRLVENPAELERWVKATKNFSIAHMKELIVSVEVFGVDLDQAVTRLKTMMEYKPKSSDGDDSKGAFGFA